MPEIVLEDPRGDYAVFVDPDGDHIVVRFMTSAKGQKYEIPIGSEAPAYDKTVARAQRGLAFL